MNAGRSLRGAIGLFVAGLALVAGWWIQQDRADQEPPAVSDSPGCATSSDLDCVGVADLPPEAAETLALIDAGGPFPYDRDGITFHNFEGILPEEPDGYYREYTVETPGIDHRGARRIVTGSEGEHYWTDDHYESFSVIVR